MGRTKRRHREWKKQMRKKTRRQPSTYGWGLSPGRLVAWHDPEREENHAKNLRSN
jgi:hypothetical protein